MNLCDLSGPQSHQPTVPRMEGGRAVQYSTVQYSTVQYSTVQYSTVQYSTVQYSTVQYSTVQYSTVQYRARGDAYLSMLAYICCNFRSSAARMLSGTDCWQHIQKHGGLWCPQNTRAKLSTHSTVWDRDSSVLGVGLLRPQASHLHQPLTRTFNGEVLVLPLTVAESVTVTVCCGNDVVAVM
jgi:hypothetical protein